MEATEEQQDGRIVWDEWAGKRSSCYINGVDHFSEVYSRAWGTFIVATPPSPGRHWSVEDIDYLVAVSDMANWTPKGKGWEAVAWPDLRGCEEVRAIGETKQDALDALAKELMGARR